MDGRARRRRMTMRVTRALFAIVAVVAGPVGVLMLIAPDETDRYFSWPIGPAWLAAAVGGFYVASAVVFGLATRRDDWPSARGLCVGVIALTVPTLVSTVRHHDVFDFGRWQAVAWVALFIAAPIAYGRVLFLCRGQVVDEGDQLARWARGVLIVLAFVYGRLALVLWLDPSAETERNWLHLPAMSGRFLGCWAAFLATLAVFAVLRNRWRESVIPLLALMLWPIGALAAAFRTSDELVPGDSASWYIAALVVLAAAAGAVLVAGRKPATASAPSP